MSDDLTLPWSIEDGAKALKQVFKIFDEIAKRTRGAVDYIKTRRRRNVAEDIDFLRFGQGGSLPNVARIARGEGTPDDFAAIRRNMNETAVPVEQAIIRLTSAGNSKLIRENIGIDALTLLEEIIHGDEGMGGKRAVRLALNALASSGGDPGVAQEQAQMVLELIGQLNGNIIRLHNSLLKHKARRDKDAVKKAEEKPTAKAVPAAKKKPPEKAKPKAAKKPAAKAKAAKRLKK